MTRCTALGSFIAAAALYMGTPPADVVPSALSVNLADHLWPDGDAPAMAAVWALRTGDARCDETAYLLRRAQARYRPDFDIVVVAVGGGDTGLLEVFLRRERVDATVVEMSARRYYDLADDDSLPALHFFRNGVAVADDVAVGEPGTPD